VRSVRAGVITVAALGATACGGAHFANLPRPPSPINLTVYINDQRVSVSPNDIGAGPVVLIVTNQASNAESLQVLPVGRVAQPLASTGPISPQAAAQVTVNLAPGEYSIAIAPGTSTEAAAATPSGIQPALIRVGKPRPSASNQLLSP
jgi:hypothetical protein